MEPTAVPSPAAPIDGRRRRRRFGEVLEELIEECTALGGAGDAVDRSLDAVVAALDATSAALLDPGGDAIAASADLSDADADAGEAAAEVVVEAGTPEGDRLVVRFAGPPTVTPRQLTLVAQLVGLVRNISDARLRADARFESQRQAWGQEIHDGVTQSVTAAILALERVRSAVDGTAAGALVASTQEHVRQSLAELREVLACVVDDDGRLVSPNASETLQDVVDDVRTRWRLQARVTVRGDLAGIDREVAAVARAVVREALINVTKHAAAGRVTVAAAPDRGRLRVSVVDDGVGLQPAPGGPQPGLQLGLRLLEQRVTLAGGTLAVGASAGGGTEVLAILPLQHA